MTDNIEHLILEQSRALRNQIAEMQTEMHTEFGDVKHRINRLESAIAGIHAATPKAAATDRQRRVTIPR